MPGRRCPAGSDVRRSWDGGHCGPDDHLCLHFIGLGRHQCVASIVATDENHIGSMRISDAAKIGQEAVHLRGQIE